MPILTHAGVNLRYDRTGGGPAVLLVHGWTCNRTFWERQVQALRARHTVVTVDLRGHGESSPPRSVYGLGAMAADLEHLVRALGLARVAVAGWSMGGMIAQELALRLGDRVSHLALVGTTAGGLTDAKNPLAEPALAAETRAGVAADFRAFARGFAPQVFKAGADSPLCAWATAQTQRTPAHVAAACLETVLGADLRPRLGDLRVPTAVLHGRHDQIFRLPHGEALARLVPGAALTVFEESGHAPFLEETDRFNTVLLDFLAGAAAPAEATPAPRAGARKPAKKPRARAR